MFCRYASYIQPKSMLNKKRWLAESASHLSIGVRDEIRTHTAQRPLPPQSSVSTNSTTRTINHHFPNSRLSHFAWSGKRDSNPRPRPWQGRALPTELFPRVAAAVVTILYVNVLLERKTGLEPATPTLARSCSTN